MRQVPPALQASLDSGATTLARAWKIVRRDGATLGFTDHDEDIVFGGVTFRAATGIEGSEVTTRLGFSADAHEIAGALSSDTLGDADLAAGRYDGAGVELWLVDWQAPENRLLLRAGAIGEVKREGAAFAAEVRGLAHRLDEERGRLYTAGCAADLGDAHCRVDLSLAAYRGLGTVVAIEGASRLRVAGLDAFAADWFAGGRLAWTGGANAGLAVEVKDHRVAAGEVRLALWQQMPEPVAPGDAFVVAAGCDKRFETCRAKFANAANFRGFPHMPGNDFVLAYPVQGEPGHDGGRLA